MNVLLLVSTLLCLTFREVANKAYTKKTEGGVYTYTVLAGIGTVAFFLITSGKLDFQPGIIPYAFAFGISYLMAGIFTLKAIAIGSLSLTSLVVSCSLILPTLYGLIFLKENGSLFLYIGIVLLIGALILVNKTDAEAPVTGRWLLYVFLAFIGNGCCSVFQKAQQDAFNGEGKNELMIMALVIVILVNLVLAIIHDRGNLWKYAQNAMTTGLPGGVSNGVVNLFVMIMLGRMPASVVFPLISGGGIVLTHLVSRFYYKERLTRNQTLGFLLGILSVIFLNL